MYKLITYYINQQKIDKFIGIAIESAIDAIWNHIDTEWIIKDYGWNMYECS